MNTEIPNQQYSNLTRVEKTTLHNLKNDHSIVIIEAAKCSAVAAWGREEKELHKEDVYEEFHENPSYLETIIMKALCKIKKLGDI